MKSDVRPCKCQNAYQDEKYGKGQRVQNNTAKEGVMRCTVCGAENKFSAGGKK